MKHHWLARLSATAVALLIVMVAAPAYADSSPVFPINGQWTLTSPYGYRTHPIAGNRDFHEGADIGVPVGTPVHAAMAGTVVQAGWRGGYGYTVEVNHGNGYSTLYGHLSQILVSPGTVVAAGQVIALSGNTGNSTGPHLHFEVRWQGKPTDPAQWFPALAGGTAQFGIGPTPGGAGNAIVSGAAGLASEILSGLRGEINQWLVGVFLSLLLMVILPAQALTDFGGMLEAIKSGNWNIGGPTPLYPWRLDVSGGVSGLAVTVGVILWLFAVLRGARRMMEGEESPLPVIQALVANLALVVAAPLIVRAGAAVYNTAYRSILEVLPEQVRHNTAHLLWSLLGLESWAERAAFFALASLGYITNLIPVSDFLAQLGQAALGLPTVLIVLWAIALTAVGVQVLAALLFLGLTPALVWIFGLFGDSWRAVTTWLLMVGRAFLAAGAAAAAGALWLGMNVNGTLGRGLLGSLSMPLLSTALYFFLALVIWSLWTRPALVVLYAGLPAAGRALVGVGAVATGAGRVVSVLPGGRALGAMLVGAGGTLREWGRPVQDLQQRLRGVAEEGRSPLASVLRDGEAVPASHEFPDPFVIETVDDGRAGLLEEEGSGVIRRRIRVASDAMGDLLEAALRQRYGANYEKMVRREDGRTFLVPLDFNEKDSKFQGLFRSQVAGRLPVIRRHGHYYAFVNGAWSRVPPRWAEAPNALFLGDADRSEGGAAAVEEREQWALEDLSHDVYVWQKVKLVHLPWFGLAFLAGLFLIAALPLPWLILRLVVFGLPPVGLAVWINLDGPRLFRQWWTWRWRVRAPGVSGVFFAPDAGAMAVTATPICDLGGNTWLAAAVVQAPPYALAGPQERAVRRRAWASLLNTAAAHGVQVDIFAGRHPWARAHPLLASVHVDEHDGPLADLARWRLRHFTEQAVERGYETTLVVRLVAGARDAAEAWHLFSACRSAFAGAGMSWEWVSGAYLAEMAYDWADPGAAIRRFVRDVERALEGQEDDAEGAERRAG